MFSFKLAGIPTEQYKPEKFVWKWLIFTFVGDL